MLLRCQVNCDHQNNIHDGQLELQTSEINRIYRWSMMQTEKVQPEGKQMLKMRFTEFPALSIDPKVGISRSSLETDV